MKEWLNNGFNIYLRGHNPWNASIMFEKQQNRVPWDFVLKQVLWSIKNAMEGQER